MAQQPGRGDAVIRAPHPRRYLANKMTLILTLGNNDQMIQISDRRLSSNGKLIDDESNKCGVLFCKKARTAFGYTGLAQWKSFNTQKWLLKALHDSAQPDYSMGGILKRLKLNATSDLPPFYVPTLIREFSTFLVVYS